MQQELEPLFPYVAIIAQDVLYIPCSGVTIEQYFSIARYYYWYNWTYNRSTFSALIIGRNYLSCPENVVAKAEAFVNNGSRSSAVKANALVEVAPGCYVFSRNDAIVEVVQRHYKLENAIDLGLISKDNKRGDVLFQRLRKN